MRWGGRGGGEGEGSPLGGPDVAQLLAEGAPEEPGDLMRPDRETLPVIVMSVLVWMLCF